MHFYINAYINRPGLARLSICEEGGSWSHGEGLVGHDEGDAVVQAQAGEVAHNALEPRAHVLGEPIEARRGVAWPTFFVRNKNAYPR